MSTLNLVVSGRCALINEILKPGYLVQVVLTTPEEDDADLTAQLSITPPGGEAQLFALSVVEQSKLESLLLPEGGAYGTALKDGVAAEIEDLVSDFNTAYDAMEVAVIAETGAGEVAAVTAELASQQTTIAAIIEGVVDAVTALVAPEEEPEEE